MFNIKIFIAEDEPLVLQGFKAIIEDLGHICIGTAMDGKTAIDEILEKKPELVILDLNMPLIGGLEVINCVRKKMQIPFIVVTGYRDAEHEVQASELGVFGYLHKPVDEYEIRSAIEVTMSRFLEMSGLELELKRSKEALENRKYIERAKGIVMRQRSLSEEKAMKYLQHLSQEKNEKLVTVAMRIIDADRLLNG